MGGTEIKALTSAVGIRDPVSSPIDRANPEGPRGWGGGGLSGCWEGYTKSESASPCLTTKGEFLSVFM